MTINIKNLLFCIVLCLIFSSFCRAVSCTYLIGIVTSFFFYLYFCEFVSLYCFILKKSILLFNKNLVFCLLMLFLLIPNNGYLNYKQYIIQLMSHYKLQRLQLFLFIIRQFLFEYTQYIQSLPEPWFLFICNICFTI